MAREADLESKVAALSTAQINARSGSIWIPTDFLLQGGDFKKAERTGGPPPPVYRKVSIYYRDAILGRRLLRKSVAARAELVDDFVPLDPAIADVDDAVGVARDVLLVVTRSTVFPCWCSRSNRS